MISSLESCNNATSLFINCELSLFLAEKNSISSFSFVKHGHVFLKQDP